MCRRKTKKFNRKRFITICAVVEFYRMLVKIHNVMFNNPNKTSEPFFA